MNTPTFICSVCGAEHPAVLEERGKDVSEEERNKLRQAWHKAAEKMFRPGLNEEQLQKAEEAEIKTSAAYANTNKWKFWAVPETLTSFRKGGQHRIACVTCAPQKV